MSALTCLNRLAPFASHNAEEYRSVRTGGRALRIGAGCEWFQIDSSDDQTRRVIVSAVLTRMMARLLVR